MNRLLPAPSNTNCRSHWLKKGGRPCDNYRGRTEGSEMSAEQLYHLLGQRPFRPVRVHVRDGRTFDIAAREFAVVGVSFLDVGAQAANAPEGIWGPTTRIRLDDISRIEELKASSTKH